MAFPRPTPKNNRTEKGSENDSGIAPSLDERSPFLSIDSRYPCAAREFIHSIADLKNNKVMVGGARSRNEVLWLIYFNPYTAATLSI